MIICLYDTNINIFKITIHVKYVCDLSCPLSCPEVVSEELSLLHVDKRISVDLKRKFADVYLQTDFGFVKSKLTTTHKAGRQVLTLNIRCRHTSIVFKMRALHEILKSTIVSGDFIR